MKCIVLKHEFATSENGNVYCKLEVRPDNDAWAASFNYVMFVTEAMQEALEANFPKFIWLEEKRIPSPEPFYRVWQNDGPNYTAGEFVSRTDRNDPSTSIPVVFNDIKVVIRTLPDGTPARGEDVEKLAQSQWNRSVANGSFIPLSAYGDEESVASSESDPFAGAETAESIEDSVPVQQTQQTQQRRPGVTVPRR